MAVVLLRNKTALAWTEDEKGGFKEEYIPPHKIPVVSHEPWQDRNIRLPVTTRAKVIKFLKAKLKNGLYERSQSSYRSGFFAVEKKDGKICIVHDLQKLNSVTICDAGVPPLMDEMTEELAGCHIYTSLDAFAGYDQMALHSDSRDLTTFESPIGTLRLRRMPQGWTNAVAAFQRAMVYMFAEEAPDLVCVYIDDVTVKGPRTQYLGPDGKPKKVPGTDIQRYVYEHALSLNRVLHKMRRFGGTFSGGKIHLGVPEVQMVGYICSAKGRKITKTATAKIEKWPRCTCTKEVRGFLGTVGVCRNWIKNYGKIARPLVLLTKTPRGTLFVWTVEHDEAMDEIKRRVILSGWIRPIDYSRVDKYPVIVAIDTSITGCGIELAQMGEDGKRYPARFYSIYYNKVQQGYSQPKLELYGIYVGLRAVRHYMHNIRFILESDCMSIKQMINSPILPSAAEARWCWYIKLNNFIFKHVPRNGWMHTVKPRRVCARLESHPVTL